MTALAKISVFLLSRPRWLALALGLLAATGFPPLALWPLTLLAMAGLTWLIFTADGWREAAFRGWLFGAAHFTLANNWIATAFTYQAEMPVALGWAAVPLLSLYLAVYPALAAAAARLLPRGQNIGWFGVFFAGTWAISEWLRSWVFTGFAWDPLGLSLLGGFERQGIAALLPWMGTYALSGLVIVFAASVLALILSRKFIPAVIAMFALIGGMYFPAPEQREGTLAFTLIQPDIRQEELNDVSKFEGHFVRSAQLSRKRRDVEKRIVMWPESGVPDYIRDGYPQRYYNQMTVMNPLTGVADPAFARFRLGRVVGEGGMLLTGVVDLEIENGRAAGARNAVTALSEQGEIVAGYDKAHLVPYGEYLALRWLLEPLGATRLVAGTIDFWPGPGPQTLELGDWGKAGVQICYEIVFSGDVVDPENRPDYIFNPSNDGWFGSWGPPQHLAQARMRAIEEGLPVLRSTTTGISAVIDANGIVRNYIGMRRDARIDGFVPPAKAPTLFSRLGNWLPMGWAILAIALSLVATRLRRG